MQRFIDTWQVNNNINLFLINSINDEYFLHHPIRKTSALSEQFLHIHNARMLWIRQNDPKLVDQIVRLNNGNKTKKEELQLALIQSGEAIATILERAIQTNKFRGFGTPLDFLNYILSMESQHRNNIIISLAFLSNHN